MCCELIAAVSSHTAIVAHWAPFQTEPVCRTVGGSVARLSGRRVDGEAALKAGPRVPHLPRDDRNTGRCLV